MLSGETKKRVGRLRDFPGLQSSKDALDSPYIQIEDHVAIEVFSEHF